MAAAHPQRECGPATFRALVNQFGGAEGALQALPVLSRRGGRVQDIHLCSEEEVEAELAAASGINNLIKQGATLTTSARDVIETLAPILGRPLGPSTELASSDEERTPEPLPDIGQSERERIVAALGPSPVDIDELIRVTGVENRKVRIVLLELDLAGASSATAGSSYR